MNEGGTVAGVSLTPTGEQHVFVWNKDAGMFDLGTGPHGFAGAWVVGISYHGDVAGITAPCLPSPGQTCAGSGDPRPVLWRKIR